MSARRTCPDAAACGPTRCPGLSAPSAMVTSAWSEALLRRGVGGHAARQVDRDRQLGGRPAAAPNRSITSPASARVAPVPNSPSTRIGRGVACAKRAGARRLPAASPSAPLRRRSGLPSVRDRHVQAPTRQMPRRDIGIAAIVARARRRSGSAGQRRSAAPRAPPPGRRAPSARPPRPHRRSPPARRRASARAVAIGAAKGDAAGQRFTVAGRR